jgi:4a-hydroxytetrahydrobiopterin dehydratase
MQVQENVLEKAKEKPPEKLSERHCVPCEGGVPALDDATSKMLLAEVPGWELRAAPGQPAQIAKRFEFADFLGAMAFVDKMAALAEGEGHHPDFCVHYSRVDVSLWTHASRGLSENDFILASKLDAIVS